jgi:amino acid efflux transporter
MSGSELTKSLSLTRGTAVLLNVVIGAGLLALPGLAIQKIGNAALYAWLLCALAAAPLLAVFVIMGRNYPDAGGVASFARSAFGLAGYRIASVLFLGAVVLGLPAIALTGGHYAASVVGGSAHLWASILLLLGALSHFISSEGAAKANTFIASLVLIVIASFLAIGVAGVTTRPPAGIGLPPAIPALSVMLVPFMMLFFAFTGWEVGAGVTEEFKKPRRDFPIAMVCSFVIATAFYVAIAFVAQQTDLAGAYEAPFVAIVEPVLGAWGSVAVSATAVLLVFANLAGAIWGVSRLVFSLARENIIPRAFDRTHDGSPRLAVVIVASILLLVVGLDAVIGVGLPRLIGLAGQNFLILYGLTAAALFAVSQRVAHRMLAAGVVVLCTALLLMQTIALLYPLCLTAFAYGAHVLNSRKQSPLPLCPTDHP